jgi:hypothetical protein
MNPTPSSGFNAYRSAHKGGKRDAAGLGHKTPAPHQIMKRHGGRRGRRSR